MNIQDHLKYFNSVPFNHAALLSCLRGYERPNDKIVDLVKKGKIIRLKRGLYISGDFYRNSMISKELLANNIYGPSYVSLDYALSYYGLIPEKVNELTSITIKATKKYNTPFGSFSYIKSPGTLYKIGIESHSSNNNISFLIASPIKALCDKIIFTKKLNITSKYDMTCYLEDDLRIDTDDLSDHKLEIIKYCIEAGYKSRPLEILYKTLAAKVKYD